MLWRSDPELLAAQSLPDWPLFHAACARQRLYFTKFAREGRRAYRVEASTLDVSDLPAVGVSTGVGDTLLEAMEDAFDGAQALYPAPEARPYLIAMMVPNFEGMLE